MTMSLTDEINNIFAHTHASAAGANAAIDAVMAALETVPNEVLEPILAGVASATSDKERAAQVIAVVLKLAQNYPQIMGLLAVL